MSYPESDWLNGRAEKLQKSMPNLGKELDKRPFHYRYSGGHSEEGYFLARTFWIVEAKALHRNYEEAGLIFDVAIAGLGKNHESYSEMIDAATGEYLAYIPQGLTHLAVLQAAPLAGYPL